MPRPSSAIGTCSKSAASQGRTRYKAAAIGVGIALAASSPAFAGLIFSNTYDSTVSGLANFNSQIKPAFLYAEQQFSNLYNDNITINVILASSSTVGLGQSTYFLQQTDYAGVKSALAARAK